jgi:hydroxyacylglutathione hydrolase
MRLHPGIDVVGSGLLGFSISHPEDSHVYLLHDGGQAVLIDSGCGLDQDLILQHIDAADVARTAISGIYLTHAHADHSAGALGLSRELGAQVYASAEVAAIVRSGDEAAAGLEAGRLSGAYPPEVRLLPTPVTEIVDDATCEVGTLTFRAHRTSGHADGHMCFSVRVGIGLAVFTGDLLFSRGRVAVLATPDTDVSALANSIRSIAALEPELLLPGHGCVVMSGAAQHLRPALARLDGQELPPPFMV